MKTTDNFNKFDSIVNNYVNGNIHDYMYDLNKLNKTNLIRFTLFLSFRCYRFEVCVNEHNNLKLREISN